MLERKPAALVLVSAFKSLSYLVESMFGKVASYFLSDRFKNAEVIKLVNCPILLIHGKKDGLVPCQHSQVLFRNAGGPCSLMLSE